MPPGAPFRDRSVPLPQCFRAAMPPPGIHVLIRRFECGFLEFVTAGRTSSLRAENRMDCQFEVGGRARPLQGPDMAEGIAELTSSSGSHGSSGSRLET